MRPFMILPLVLAAAACAPVVDEQPVNAAIPQIFEPEPFVVAEAPPPPPPSPPRAAAARPSGPVGPLPEAPEGAGEGLPPGGQAACGGVGIEANC